VIVADFDAVLDTSAVLAVLKEEQGAARVRARMESAAISVVNLAEIATKLTEWEVPPPLVIRSIEQLQLRVLAFDRDLAIEAGLLNRCTKGRDISLGDRACLVTARHFGVPAVTGDRGWQHTLVLRSSSSASRAPRHPPPHARPLG
jgi:PIN domain nuclease of toxin-antitoxin system